MSLGELAHGDPAEYAEEYVKRLVRLAPETRRLVERSIDNAYYIEFPGGKKSSATTEVRVTLDKELRD